MVNKHSRILMLIVVLIMIFMLQSANVIANETESCLNFKGEDYCVKLVYSNKSGIPDNAVLKVTEIYEGSKEYIKYLKKTENLVDVSFARYFDVCIMDGEKEIEPDQSVKVMITYDEGVNKAEDDNISIIHFKEDGEKEMIDIQEEYSEEVVKKITFEQDSFSVIGMIIFDGNDTSIKSSDSEIITDADVVNVTKEWSDGNAVHKKDAVTVSLYEQSDDQWNKINEIVLNNNNSWKDKFSNLDKSKKYSLKETKIESDRIDVTTTYKSEISVEYDKKWCKTTDNNLIDGKKVILTFDSGKMLLRKSADYDQMHLRTYEIEAVSSITYGKYLKTEIPNNCIWIAKWNEDDSTWNLYNEAGNSYLTLVYNDVTKVYEWTTSRELTEGSNLSYVNGTFSATLGNVTRYLGNVNGNGPYEGVTRWSTSITKFEIFSYKIFQPVNCKIYNTKNETEKEHETNVDVITSKTIDYLGDGKDNPETDVDNGIAEENILKDLYRLKLSVKMQTDVTGLDLLMVIDVSSSMEGNEDARDDEGNNIKRSEALRQALNRFIPEFLPENTKNRLAVVAFESESMILQQWTDNSAEILEKVNYQTNGKMPLYSGEGTNYEAALARAHELLSMRGYSNNAQAMIFLSDGDPTVYIEGNDELEAGNITYNLGLASLSEKGIEGEYPEGLKAVWGMEDESAEMAAKEAIFSFKKHNPEIMTGTIAFNTQLTESIRILATEEKFVTKIEKGSPTDLIKAMELITEYVPSKIVITDTLTDNVELYEKYPDVKVMEEDEIGNQKILYSTKTGITDSGKDVLNNETPVIIKDKQLKIYFQDEYQVQNNNTYSLSFNVNASQKAFDQFADEQSKYTDKGDDNTDYIGNETSSLKEGFYSNEDNSNVSYYLNGVKVTKKYRKPVVQVRDGELTVIKTDQDGKIITSGAVFELYRDAEENDDNKVTLSGTDKEYVKIGEGTTDENGKISFKHLRLAVFDKGYPYYLIETKAPEGYTAIDTVLEFMMTENGAKLISEDNRLSTDQKGNLVVKNGVFTDFSFTKVNEKEEPLSGARFEIDILDCEEDTHDHVEDCFLKKGEAVSNPNVEFENLLPGNIYRIREVKAPDGFICPSGYWLLCIDIQGNIKIENVGNSPDLTEKQDGLWTLKNEEEIVIPVTGGEGISKYLIIGIGLIIGGIIYMKKKKSFSGFFRVFAIIMAAISMFTMPVHAIDKNQKGTITVNGIENKVIVNVYQMMDVTYDYEVNQPKNPMYMWRNEVAKWVNENYPSYIDTENNNQVMEAFSKGNDNDIAVFYDKLAVAIKAGKVSLPMNSVTAAGSQVVIQNLPMGNYFILIEDGVKVYRPLTANVVPEWTGSEWKMTTPAVDAKSSAPAITKTVDGELKKDNYNVGDIVNFELNAVIADYPENALAKKYVISDKLSDGLTLIEESLKVYGVNSGLNPVLIKSGYSRTSQRPASAVKDNVVTFSLDFNYDAIKDYETLKITYSAILNEKAVIGNDGNINKAYLDYNNNPYVESSWKSDDDDVIVYTYGIKVFKVDEETKDGLDGAKFTLKKNGEEIRFTGSNGDYTVAKENESGQTLLEVSSTGLLTLRGLDADEYVLTEEQAPDGYVKLQNPINISIKDDNLNGRIEYENGESEDGFYTLTVENDKGFILPVTGGMGTTAFYVLGIILTCAGGVLIASYLRKKKKD